MTDIAWNIGLIVIAVVNLMLAEQIHCPQWMVTGLASV